MVPEHALDQVSVSRINSNSDFLSTASLEASFPVREEKAPIRLPEQIRVSPGQSPFSLSSVLTDRHRFSPRMMTK